MRTERLICHALLIWKLLVSVSSTSVESLQRNDEPHYAIVTLLSNPSTGYRSGAMVLAQSLIDQNSTLQRAIMVTSDVDSLTRTILYKLYHHVIEVEEIECNFKAADVANSLFDMDGPHWTASKKRWAPTCTKLAAWSLYQFDRVIYLDCDMIVIGNIDNVLTDYTQYEVLAAPEILPPDTFNSGFMVLSPSRSTFSLLLSLNQQQGSFWAGDQSIINYGLCPLWHLGESDLIRNKRNQIRNKEGKEITCGRLPWIYNTQAVNYHAYSIVQIIGGNPHPKVIHFVGEGKPWTYLLTEYQVREFGKKIIDSKLQVPHALWRRAYYKVCLFCKDLVTITSEIEYGEKYAQLWLDTQPPGFLSIQMKKEEEVKTTDNEEKEREKENKKDNRLKKKKKNSNKKKKDEKENINKRIKKKKKKKTEESMNEIGKKKKKKKSKRKNTSEQEL
mmetsp:Transcript_31647/g.32241  ORF Transcript_31647/g.32241 Transcript_31647/m.32241 type:complete len:445 (+) Transcript_31647:316-1650(+)|eukprot:CAMPEP_0182419726 /NCGR_PEP_ID=MMETSP1167-20130531/4112_1 /TAXON_ID=2988 /ORGANISM="Mallomonas Sp, Strain CCMP3275" /LENGTH=444 /DNA_ID=CAMNT_0024594793 /DNA_START=267 /DNA_END=1604 /DNA_ORIENTATION=-